MTTYYKKLDAGFLPPPADPDKIKGELAFHYGYIKYYKITDREYLKSLHYSFKIPPTGIFLSEGHGPLEPHFDNGQRASINYYMRTGGYTTSFWVPQENAKKRISKRYDHATNSYVDGKLGYMRENLIFADSFVAKDGEAYVLNVEQIHSVEGEKPTLPRAFIQMQWDFSMDELLEKLDFK